MLIHMSMIFIYFLFLIKIQNESIMLYEFARIKLIQNEI